jgi:hypothetical protein
MPSQRSQPCAVSGRDRGRARRSQRGRWRLKTKNGIEPALLCCWNHRKSVSKHWVGGMSTSRSRSEMHRLSFRTSVPTRRLSTWREFSRAIDMWGTGAVLELHQSIINDFSDSLGVGRTGHWSRLTTCYQAGGPRALEVICESFGILNKLTKLLQSGSEWYNVTVGPVAT